MADLSYDDVRKILAMLDNSTLDEVHLEIGDFKLDVRRRGAPATSPQSDVAPVTARDKVAQSSAAQSGANPAPQLAEGQFALVAPMLGTFYRAPAPGAPPFVEIGSTVAANDTLCIIEVMKLMNTIKAERAGRVVAILAENATMVEFGQPLIVFELP